MESMNTFCGQQEAAVKKIDALPPAMAYVPWQSFKNIYKAEDALRQGTIFEELDLPFTGRRCQK
ncbi:MAG: spore coat associated protein CotJA [Clostridiales bacterium]|uniref:Spore coat associated protein CotJA n=1 Tax=Candidatus Anaerobutyricum stercoripullorum TaxID=2838456 RepID=A0A9D2BE95_9FIRM|nr:spore coat associated protein CotJA [Clostridiales bacterium]HIX72853.1 spore coat associated protein CotJA [Candidatus Anaerobutyricum stercoripullorum]